MDGALWDRLEADAAFPLCVLLSLTERCPLACGHCYVGRGDAARELTLAELEALFDELAALGTLRLGLTGGDPALREDLEAIVSAAWERRFVITLKTSAALLDRADIARLRERGLAVLHVSLYHVDPEEHDRFVGQSGAWRRATGALETFRALGGIAIANTVIMGWNAAAMTGLRALCARKDWSFHADPKIIRSNDGADRAAALGAPVEALAAAMRDVQDDPWSGGAPRDPGQPVCTAGEGTVYVNSDGEVWLCPTLPISLGNVRQRPLRRIWEESELRKRVLAHRWGDSAECMTCRKNRTCERCPGEAYLEHGDYRHPASADCRVAAAYAAAWPDESRES